MVDFKTCLICDETDSCSFIKVVVVKLSYLFGLKFLVVSVKQITVIFYVETVYIFIIKSLWNFINCLNSHNNLF